MHKMSKIILKPFNINEKKNLILEIINFFSPKANKIYREFIGLPIDEEHIRPLTVEDFLNYLDKKYNIENSFGYMKVLMQLIKKIENEGVLICTGVKPKSSPIYGNGYYSITQLTDIQKNNEEFFFCKLLGMEYVRELYQPFIVRIEGFYKESNVSATGSGVLIDKNTILTCAHNINDLNDHKIFVGEKELQIKEKKIHGKHDIGIIKIEDYQDLKKFPYFGKPKELDRTLTLGYPPLTCMTEAVLVAQRGEINAISKDWNNGENIIISSITRPGNSGGPVVSEEGFIVGIVVNAGYSIDEIDCDKNVKSNNNAPFYNAISSNEIVKIIKELDAEFEIVFEDYKT